MTAMLADTFTVLKPVLVFVKCFGLAPYSVSGKMGSRHLRTSLFDVIYSVIFIGVSSFLVLYRSFLWDIIDGLSICSVTERIISFSVIFQFVLSASVCLLKRHSVVDVANQLAGLNAALKISCGCVWRRICSILVSHLFISLFTVTICFVSDFFLSVQDPISVSFISYNILTFVSFLTEFQIVGFFMLLKQLISDLNTSIRGLGKINGTQNGVCFCSKKSRPNRITPIFVTSSNKKFQRSVAAIMDDDSPKTKVIFLRYVQDLLCGNAETLNSAFSFLLLYTTAKTFVCLTHTLYFILLFLSMSGSNNCGYGHRSPYWYYMWFVHYALKLIWLIFYSSSAIQQVRWLLTIAAFKTRRL
jgi:hypothetical protein